MAYIRPDIRIPFDVAIEEPKLLRRIFYGDGTKAFPGLSLPQQVALKTLYGCRLDATRRDERGWSELDYYHMLQGHGEYDELGYLKAIKPGAPAYTPKEWHEATIVVGIRGGKTASVCAPAAAYEATCGGHEAFLRKGKRGIVFLIAQDLRFARWSLPGILATLEAMPMIHPSKAHSKIVRTTADRIDLWNGITIAVVPPSVKAVRGYDAPVAILDEVGVWPQEADSANPDFEIYNQVHSRQAQFSHPKIISVSSPWIKSGLLYERYDAGTEGRSIVCNDCRTTAKPSCLTCAALRVPHRGNLLLHTTTAGFGNPLVVKDWLQRACDKDPKAFERECLAQFVDALSGFLDATLLKEATEHGVVERPPSPHAYYVAAIDPAFRHDAFGFAIAHLDNDQQVVIDVLKRWPEQGSVLSGQPMNPAEILDQITPYLQKYRIVDVVSDQYHIDTLQQLALLRGWGIRQITFTGSSKAAIYGNMQQLLRQRKLRIVDHAETLRELRTIERKNMPGGTVKIGAPKGAHDDMATVAALVAHQVMWLAPKAEVEAIKTPTPFELCQAQIERRRIAHRSAW